MGKLFDFFADWTRFTAFRALFSYFCSRPEAASDVMSSTFVSHATPDDAVKIPRSLEIHLEVIGDCISLFFFVITADGKQLVMLRPV